MKDERSAYYRQGYRTGYMQAINFIKNNYTKEMLLEELTAKLAEYYHTCPLIDPLGEI